MSIRNIILFRHVLSIVCNSNFENIYSIKTVFNRIEPPALKPGIQVLFIPNVITVISNPGTYSCFASLHHPSLWIFKLTVLLFPLYGIRLCLCLHFHYRIRIPFPSNASFYNKNNGKQKRKKA